MIRKWTRFSELFLALWLIASAWLLTQPVPSPYPAIALVTGLAVVAIDVLSIARPRRCLYLLILPIAAIQIGLGLFYLPVRSPAAQNLITVALLLAILAILPTEATRPPAAWQEFTRPSARPH
jgi:hypothetical protein